LFVVQKHAARRLHYDFRLELDGVLKSWAVPKGPSLTLGDKRMAVEVEDHPFEYASFEGMIPEKQYGAGNVIVWDCGVYSPDENAEYWFEDREEAQKRIRESLAEGKLSFFLRGEKVKGSFALVRTRTDKQWLLLKHKDRFAVATEESGAEILARGRSVVSGFSLDDLPSDEALLPRAPAARLAPTGPAEALPTGLKPMLAEIDAAPKSNPEWRYEPKLDGYRVVATVRGPKVTLTSRRGIDLTPFFPEVVAELATQAVGQMVLDGEVIALEADGRPSFNAVQNRAQVKSAQQIADVQRTNPAVLMCFDLLHFAGINLRSAPYADRRRYLTQCLLPAAHIQLIHASDNAESLYKAALESGFEGIVAKRLNSPYDPGRRSPHWLKIKSTHTAEFVVGGYTQGKGARDSLGALLLGYWDGPDLHYAGHVGSGLTDPLIAGIRKRSAAGIRRTSPFVEKPPLHRPTTWVQPRLVVEVEFGEWTPEGLLRAPVFLRLREDVTPESIQRPAQSKAAAASRLSSQATPAAPARAPAPSTRAAAARPAAARAARASAPGSGTPASDVESALRQLDSKGPRLDLMVAGQKIRLTNLDRVYWPANPGQPEITKRDFLRYLAGVSPYMIPHLQDRPLTMIRMPEGIDGERFFQKHWEQSLPEYVETVTVYSEHKSGKHRYLLANNLPTLLWLGQNGTLEFHVWHSRAKVEPDVASQSTDYASSLESLEASVLNYPDFLVFDLDPYIYSGKEAKGAEPELNDKGFAGGRKVAFWLRAILRQMSLDAIVKTSGKTGLHVFVPISRTVTFDLAREICERVGRHVMREHPREITMEWATQKRTGKIFIDYNMNVRGKTLNVAYSPRSQPGAPVSMPLTWEQLEAAVPTDFTIRNVLKRLEKYGDRWHDALSIKHDLARAFATPADT
jgi:bifunctional non-homologous end joining protein LigD